MLHQTSDKEIHNYIIIIFFTVPATVRLQLLDFRTIVDNNGAANNIGTASLLNKHIASEKEFAPSYNIFGAVSNLVPRACPFAG